MRPSTCYDMPATCLRHACDMSAYDMWHPRLLLRHAHDMRTTCARHAYDMTFASLCEPPQPTEKKVDIPNRAKSKQTADEYKKAKVGQMTHSEHTHTCDGCIHTGDHMASFDKCGCNRQCSRILEEGTGRNQIEPDATEETEDTPQTGRKEETSHTIGMPHNLGLMGHIVEASIRSIVLTICWQALRIP